MPAPAIPSGGTSTSSSTKFTASPATEAGKLRVVTLARPAITTNTRKRPYSAQPSATHGSAACAPKKLGAASSRIAQRPTSVSAATIIPVSST